MANARRTLEACAEYTRGGGPPTPDHDANLKDRARRLAFEEARLLEWGKLNRRLAHRLPPEFTRGQEHQVYFQKKTRRYVKATLPHKHKGYGIALGSISHGATPSEYLDRLILQNVIFRDDIRLEKIFPHPEKPVIISSQPSIKGVQAPQREIDAMMEAKGYEKLDEGAYYDSAAGLLIFDLFPRNAVQIETGTIYPIDPVIQRVSCEFADFLRRYPHTINGR